MTLKSLRILLLLVLSMSALLMTGCQGCRNEKEKTAEEKKKEEEEKKEREKPAFESAPAVVYPGQYSDVVRKNRTKRGHWVSADFRIISNKADLTGELTATSWSTDAPIPVESTNYFVVSSRPFSLPKGEIRNLETNIYVPRRKSSSSVNIKFVMSRSAGSLGIFDPIHGTPAMKANQYHMVVLTKRPDAYGYLNVIDSVKLPANETGNVVPPFYTVVRTKPSEEPIPLPRQSLYWTTIAYLIWDNLDVDQLDAEQSKALVDWIHFGGQLILSGPDCLDKLSNSFLAEYLPAKYSGSTNLTAEDFQEVNDNWSVKVKKQPSLKRQINLSGGATVLGVEFEPHPDAEFVTGTGKIAIERKVGRGRIVLTSFSMDDKPIVRWPSYRSFFNGCLLRRPARKFGTTSDGTLSFTWRDDETSIFDPLIGSTLRYLSRDLVRTNNGQNKSLTGTPRSPEIKTEQITGFEFQQQGALNYPYNIEDATRFRPQHAAGTEVRNLEGDSWHYGGFQHDSQSGTAGWNDESGISAAARETLKRAAGITPPSSTFVLKMLAVYLIVLVPVNWLVFRMIGRVEWAWIAAPFIAIAGAFMVAKMASLDIGFVRSNSQVACVEVFADYPRAHVAQYSALYTSLSTGYDVDLDNASAQCLPLGNKSKVWKEKTNSPVVFRKTISNRLEGLQVQSNTTGLLHTEMMFDTQGVFSWDEKQLLVQNSTVLDLSEVAVLRRTESGELQSEWIGELAGGSVSQPLEFEKAADALEPWQDSEDLTISSRARQYWELLIGDADSPDLSDFQVTLTAMREKVPNVAENWTKYLQLAAMRFPEADPETLLLTEFDFHSFQEMVIDINQSDRVTVSRLFNAISENLELAKGEVRLIGITNQSVGNNEFSPASTQTQQQSLVVVHLKRSPLPAASADENTLEDFNGRSNLDWLSQDEDIEAEENLEALVEEE